MAPVPVGHTELVEREREFAALDAAVAAAVSGAGHVLLVEGEAGLGKTSVLAQLRARGAAAGLTVLAARGTELEREYPFEIIGSLLRAVRQRLPGETPLPIRRLLGLAAGGDEPLEPSRALLDAVFRLVEALSETGGVVLCVDDAQWVDGASLRALAYVANRVDGLPLLVALGRRTPSPSADDAALTAIEAQATRLALSPLSPAGTARLVGERHLSGEAVTALHTLTRGNPLLIAHVADGIARDGEDGLRAPHAVHGTAIAGLVLRRLTEASPAAVAVAQAVAVLGDGAPVAQAAAFTGLSAADTLAAAAELDRLHIFAADESLTFAHPLLATAVAEDTGANALGLAHLRAAGILRAAGAPAAQIAGHLVRGPATGDPRAVADLRAAAGAARGRAAPETAVRLQRRALEETPDAAEDPGLRVELGLAERAAGDTEAAWEQLAFTVEDPGVPADVAVGAVMARITAAGFDEGIRLLLAAAAARAETAPDDALRVTACAHYLNWFVPVGQRRALELPPTDTLTGATPGERLALAGILAHSVGPDGDAATAADLARRSLGDGALARDPAMSRDFLTGPLLGLLYAEALEDGAREVGHIESGVGDWPGAYVTSRFPVVYLQLLRGDVAATIAEATALLDVREDLVGIWGAMQEGLIVGWMALGILAHDGPAAAAAALTARGMDAALAPERVMLLPARAQVRLACGDAEGALEDALAWRAAAVATGDPIAAVEFHTAEPLALVAAGRAAEARAATERELERARRWGAPARIAGVLRCAARVDPAGAPERLEEARALVADSPLRLERARVLLDLGMAQRRRGSRADARATLQDAVQAASECQAHALAETGLEELRVLGARPRRRAFSGVASLTASERRIAEMAAAGRTNREIAQHLFLTAKTIDSHLMRAYRKLGISSRRDLAGVLAGE